MKPRCEHCRFSHVDTDEDGVTVFFRCRRYAPRPVSLVGKGGNEPDIEWDWPTVLPEHWCGEWEASR